MTSVYQAHTVAIFQSNGSSVRYFRVDSQIPCPCRTPEGYRDLDWHLQHPTATMCDPNGMLPDPANTIDKMIKAFVQPVTSARGAKLPAEVLPQLFGGDLQADDHIGIFPEAWDGAELNFFEWGRSGEDFVEYGGRRFTIVNSNLIPDPSGDPRGHWECGLRLIANG